MPLNPLDFQRLDADSNGMVQIPYELFVQMLEGVGGAVTIQPQVLMPGSGDDMGVRILCFVQNDPWMLIYKLEGIRADPVDMGGRFR